MQPVLKDRNKRQHKKIQEYMLWKLRTENWKKKMRIKEVK